MKYLSVCSGIEAATVAFRPLGWQAVGFAEIDPVCCALLKHHYPTVRNYGDFTTIRPRNLRRIGATFPDVLCGGTPCQSFSVAGRRAGLDDPRGNLAVEFALLARRLRTRWLLWENVPGVRSSWSDLAEDERPAPDAPTGTQGTLDAEVVAEAEGYSWQRSDLDYFLSLLGECGFGCAYRTLDAQYDNLAQRRERVFVVGYSGRLGQAGSAAPNSRAAHHPPTAQELRRFSAISAAVLLDLESLCGNPAPRRESRQGITGTFGARTSAGGGFGTDFDLGGGLQPCRH